MSHTQSVLDGAPMTCSSQSAWLFTAVMNLSDGDAGGCGAPAAGIGVAAPSALCNCVENQNTQQSPQHFCSGERDMGPEIIFVTAYASGID